MQVEERLAVLADAIEDKREALAAMMLESLYSDPFWAARFGKRGRKFAHQDANYNLDNLVRAVRFNILSGPPYHYSWLRQVLVHRGVSTLHLRQTIDQMGRALQAQLPGEWAEIRPYLEVGYDGLRYEAPACQQLADQIEAVTQEVAAELEAQRSPAVDDLVGWRQARQYEVRFQLAYLIDAVAFDLGEMFSEYIDWQAAFMAEGGAAPAVQRWELVLLAEAIEERLGRAAAQPFTALVQQRLEGAAES